MIINKILVVPDSFKNSLSADEVASAITEGLTYYKDKLDVKSFPFADGGEGSLEVVRRFIEVKERTVFTFDPFLKPIRASYLINEKKKIAYIESAKVIGLEILQREPDCYNASSFGLGILIGDALDQGVEHISIFLGGSATCDGGVGMAAGLGFDFLLEKRVIERPLAKDVKYIHQFRTENVHPRLSECQFKIAYDVENPLYGENGTAYTYARQKGANDEQIELLELGMLHLGKLIERRTKKDIQEMKGSGSAGGIGAGAFFFLKGKLESAFEMLSNISGLNVEVESADIVITGEGHIDDQTFQGKLIQQIKRVADEYEKPVWLISAIRSISEKEALRKGYSKIHSLYRSRPKEINIPETRKKLFKVGKMWAEELLNMAQNER